jgi:hypothetical protein
MVCARFGLQAWSPQRKTAALGGRWSIIYLLFQPLAIVATALATYSRLPWFNAATQMRPVPTA